MPEPPIACKLDDEERRQRRRMILATVGSAAVHAGATPHGYRFRFAPAADLMAQLGLLLDLERHCCPFLTFTIVVPAGDEPVCLEVTGPEAAQGVIAEMFSPRP